MLGRLRRTTRFDVALALSFAGFAYLAWAAAAGVGRWMLATASAGQVQGPLSAVAKGLFVDGALVLNLAGLAWLCLSLTLVVRASRQRCSVSWAWVSSAFQMLAAAGAAILAGLACRAMIPTPSADPQYAWDLANSLSLPVMLAVAVLVWVTFLVWLLVERARMDRYGPTLRDGLRTNAYR